MRKLLGIACVVVLSIVGLKVAFANRLFDRTSSSIEPPPELMSKLISFRQDLDKESQKSAADGSDIETNIKRFKGVRDALIGSGSGSNQLVPILIDGLELQSEATLAQNRFNTASLMQMELAANAMVTGEGYAGTDPELQQLETRFPEQDKFCESLESPEKRISQLMESIESDTDTNSESKRLLRAAVTLGGIEADKEIGVYREDIKPGTQVLRDILDKLVKNAVGS